MQGESDHGTSQAAYPASLALLIAVPRAAGCAAPWLIGMPTYAAGVDTNVQAAQPAAPDSSTIFAGANTDT